MIRHLKKLIASHLGPLMEMESREIEKLFEAPKHTGHGQLALPLFSIAKIKKKAPPLLAQELAQTITMKAIPELKKAEALAGFVNFHFLESYLQNTLIESIETQGSQLGFSKMGEGQRVVVDYASPNVAKPMSIGHLRATMIGQAVCNLARSQGYTVIGLNYLGDWGSQFGKLAWAFQKWGHEYPFEKQPIDSLYKMYVRFQEEADKDPEIAKLGAQTFKKLEDGDSDIKLLWKKFIDLSLVEYQRLFDMLGVKHDLVQGESFYNDKLKPTEKLLEQKNLLEESEGAMVVRVGDDVPPCLIRKSDGASLYATRDIASAIYRRDHLKADISLYVVGMDQTLHFKQVFRVLEKMGYSWFKDCHHIAFGMYRFKDIGRMSTRKGNVIFLEDVLSRAIQMVREIIEEKNPQLEDKSKVAEQVGIGAIIFNDLVNDRVKNVDFDWDLVLNFEGDSGPYVQYMNVRCKSLLRKYGKEPAKKFLTDLDSPEEAELIRLLLSYPVTLEKAYVNFKPHILAGYLLDICHQFSRFYSKHRILGEAEALESSRMTLIYCTQKILSSGLKILNMPTPEAM